MSTESSTKSEAQMTEDRSFPNQKLVSILFVAGFGLLLIPEPITSALGIALVTVGGGLWVRGLLR